MYYIKGLFSDCPMETEIFIKQLIFGFTLLASFDFATSGPKI